MVLLCRALGSEGHCWCSRNWVWQKHYLKSVHFTTGASVGKLMSHQFHRVLAWINGSFRLVAAHAKLRERFLNARVQTMFWKAQKTPCWDAVNEMHPLFYGRSDPSASWVSRQTFRSAPFCWTRISASSCPCSCWFSQLLRLNLSGNTKKTHAACNCTRLYYFMSFVSLNNPLVSIHYTTFVNMLLRTICVRFGWSCIWKFPKLCGSMKHAACGAWSSLHNSLLTFRMSCLAHRLLWSVSDYLQVSMLLNRSLCS